MKKHSRALLLASGPGFYTCKSSFLFTEHNQAKHHVTNTVQRWASPRRSFSGICSSRGHPRVPGKLLLPQRWWGIRRTHRGVLRGAFLVLQLHLHLCKMQGPCAGLSLRAHVPPVPSPRVPNTVFGAVSSPLIHRNFGTFICLAFFFFPCFLSLLYWLIFFFLKKCNLSVSEMPVLVKPPRTEALPPLPLVLHYL